MAGKGKRGKKKNQPTHTKQANNGSQGLDENKNRDSDQNDVLTNDDYTLLEGINISNLDPPKHTETSSDAKIPKYSMSANESAIMKCKMEERIATLSVYTPDCGHPKLERDIDDCGSNLCWVIAAMDSVCTNLKIKGADYELIKLNCNKLMKCHEEENNGYPYILKKAFKYIKDHNVSKSKFFPTKGECTITHVMPEEIRALRINGFQMIDNEDEVAIMEAIQNGPIIGGIRQSPEFAMLGNEIYHGSDNEIMIEGKYCNHGLVLISYTDEKGIGCWIVQNSEGKRWGNSGYGKVARNSSLPDNKKNLLTSIMYPIFE